MAREIQTDYTPGRSLTFTLLAGVTVVAAGTAMVESSVAGRYTGTPPGGTAAAVYTVLVFDGSTHVHTGVLNWTGTAEAQPGGGASASEVAAAVMASTAGAGTLEDAAARLNAFAPDEPIAVVPAPPVDNGTCRVYGYLSTPDGRPAAKVTMKFVLVAAAGTAAARIVAKRDVTVTTDAYGAVSQNNEPFVDLYRTDVLTPAGAVYRFTCEDLGITNKVLTFTGTTADLKVLLQP